MKKGVFLILLFVSSRSYSCDSAMVIASIGFAAAGISAFISYCVHAELQHFKDEIRAFEYFPTQSPVITFIQPNAVEIPPAYDQLSLRLAEVAHPRERRDTFIMVQSIEMEDTDPDSQINRLAWQEHEQLPDGFNTDQGALPGLVPMQRF